MIQTATNTINAHRRLCIRKDLIELSQWIENLENINKELESLKIIEHQLIKNFALQKSIIGFRRKNTLAMGTLCQYEQDLIKELEYGKREYTIPRAKEHEKKRILYSEILKEFNQIKETVYSHLKKYSR